jgi:hypothetical protein
MHEYAVPGLGSGKIVFVDSGYQLTGVRTQTCTSSQSIRVLLSNKQDESLHASAK